MHVRNFSADTLDEALKEIKRELGPDAIILKTKTNKGLIGQIKKKKIEITAAISEKNYGKKRIVDTILDGDQKEELYKGPSENIAKTIDGYGSMAINRPVKTSNKGNLDQFLSGGDKEELVPIPVPAETTSPKMDKALESKILQLEKKIECLEDKVPDELFKIRNNLRSLDINESYIQQLLKKATFELSLDDLETYDLVFEFALREMIKEIKTEMPKFSGVNEEKEGVITLLISESSSGQTSMVEKLASLKNNSIVIKNTISRNEKPMANEVFDYTIAHASGITNIVSECRKGLEQKRAVFIDYKVEAKELNDSKKVIEALKRLFPSFEVLVNISSIHSEAYNRKVLTKYHEYMDGITVAHLDLCLSFGPLFNLATNFPEIPFKFFGTGEMIPDDIEAASPERILAGLFKFEN
jgi:flagellar biosynthesis GTPase FlhF